MRQAASIVLACFSVGQAAAAPFCLQIAGIPPQCIYVDTAACRHEARRQNGVCGLNPREILPPAGPRFCAVSNGPAVQCLYADRRSCDSAAMQSKGICIDAGADNARPDPDRIPR